jgi:hypothetical protein
VFCGACFVVGNPREKPAAREARKTGASVRQRPTEGGLSSHGRGDVPERHHSLAFLLVVSLIFFLMTETTC